MNQPPPQTNQPAPIKGLDEYQRLYRRSLDDPEGFWAEQARELLSWEREWDFVRRWDPYEARLEFFGGGRLNAAANCLDRHLEQRRNQVAYYWEGDDPAQSGAVTYLDLYRRVNKLAAVLKSRGVVKGDRVGIHLPLTVDLPAAMLACARIGAVHCVVFGGYSTEAIAHRLGDCGAKAVITAASASRAGKEVHLKEHIDQALAGCPGVETVLVLDRGPSKPRLQPGRDVSWRQALADPKLPDLVPPESMDAEDPLFILYASLSTGKPVGLVHSHGGYLVQAALTTRLLFDPQEGETFWSTPDPGWIGGHTYGVYGPLLCGLTSLLFEGAPNYPTPDRCYRLLDKYQVDRFYTAPSFIKLLREGGEPGQAFDLASLKLLGSVGEPLDPETWQWYNRHLGRERCPIVNTYSQTESGGPLIASLPGLTPVEPGSCGLPVLGVEPILLDPNTGEEAAYAQQEGALFIRPPWPGMARTIWGDHERFIESYFAPAAGFYFTGDLAKRDEAGLYWIGGRVDDVINVSGHRLGTGEIEAVLVDEAPVVEAAVVGFPHPMRGQGIYAFVTLAPEVEKSDRLKSELSEAIRRRLGPIALPDAIQWADALPKTRTGKVLRRLLQLIASGQTANLGDTSIVAEPDLLEELIRDRMGLVGNRRT